MLTKYIVSICKHNGQTAEIRHSVNVLFKLLLCIIILYLIVLFEVLNYYRLFYELK